MLRKFSILAMGTKCCMVDAHESREDAKHYDGAAFVSNKDKRLPLEPTSWKEAPTTRHLTHLQQKQDQWHKNVSPFFFLSTLLYVCPILGSKYACRISVTHATHNFFWLFLLGGVSHRVAPVGLISIIRSMLFSQSSSVVAWSPSNNTHSLLCGVRSHAYALRDGAW